MNASGRSPQPPLLFLGCLLLGWGLGFLHPLELPLPNPARYALGGALALAAAGLGAWGVVTFRRMGTTPDPNGTATALLTTGPFRHSRNPLYLALSLLLTAFGLALDSGWILLLVPVLAVLLDRLVIAREEVRLQTLFGEAYRDYTRRVRRWL